MRPRFHAGASAGIGALLAALLSAAPARATSVSEFPDNGSEQMARGGAWVARASDPLAAFYNPAGLAGQRTALTLQSHLTFQSTCFSRVKAATDTSDDPLLQGDGTFPKVCNDAEPNLAPQLGATFRITDRLGVGFVILGPSAAGNNTFPEFVDGPNGPTAPPNRFLLIRQRGLVLFPTISIGYEVIPGLRIGVGLTWGIATLRLATSSLSLNQDGLDPKNEVRGNLQVKDLFVPGATLGALYSPVPWLDVAGTYRVSDAIRARGDVGLATNYYDPKNARGDASNVRYGDSVFSDCGTGRDTAVCGDGGNATLKLPIPMEAKLGFRFHKPRAVGPQPVEPNASGDTKEHVVVVPRPRDPIADDQFDAELDLTWAHNSALDAVEIRFPSDANGDGTIPVSGVPTGAVPPNADVPKQYRDVLGVRLGGDYNLLADRLAVRAGGFFESKAQDNRYQSLDMAGTARVGFGLGLTFRQRLGANMALDLMAGYGHVFFMDSENRDPNAQGIQGLAGTPCNPPVSASGPNCPGGSQKYRANWPINLGTITNSVNMVNLGATLRF